MKKRFFSISLVLTMAISIISATTLSASAATKTLKLGDYVQMGTYYGQPILWRCVSFEKITGYDTYGNPIIDSTDTKTKLTDGYLPLMLADKIICLKSFDAKGSVTTGSHARGYYETKNGYYRQIYGSNYWGDSNLRDWLNSSATAGNVTWSCGNAPSSTNVKLGENAYDDEAGFLTNFTESELASIKTVKQKYLLDGYEYADSSNTIDPNYHQYDLDIFDCVQNYATATSLNSIDTVFIPDVQQINTVYNNKSVLGKDFFIGVPTAQAVSNSEFSDSNFNSSSKWNTLLRSPYSYYTYGTSESVRYVRTDGYLYGALSYDSSMGVRPAFYLDEAALLLSGEGTSASPYTAVKIPPTFTSTSDSGYFSQVGGDDEGIIAFTSFLSNYTSYDGYTFDSTKDKFGMFLYNPTAIASEQVDIPSTNFVELMDSGKGYFYAFVTGIKSDDFDKPVIAKPYAIINGETTWGSEISTSVTTLLETKYLGDISNKPAGAKESE